MELFIARDALGIARVHAEVPSRVRVDGAHNEIRAPYSPLSYKAPTSG